MEIEIVKYSSDKGIESRWETGFEITTKITKDKEILISANKAGLISLAKQLLALAQDDVPIGFHFHYDKYNSLEDGSADIVIEKVK